MMKWVLSISLCAVHFVVFPFLGDGNLTGKALFISLLSIGSVLWLLWRRERIFVPPFLVLFFLLICWGAFSSIFALNPVTSFLAVLFVLAVWGLQLVVVQYGLEFRDLFFKCFLVASVLASVLGLYEYCSYLYSGFSKQPLIPFLLPPDFSLRIGGMLGQSNIFALFLSVGLLVFLHSYTSEVCRNSHRFRFLPPLCVALTLFLTGSRAGLLSFLIPASLLIYLTLKGRAYVEDENGRREFYKLIAVVFAGFAVGYLITFWQPDRGGASLVERFTPHGLSAGSVSGIDIRFFFWATALAVFGENPWLGVGFDNFKYVSAEYRGAAAKIMGYQDYELFQYVKWAHNDFFQLMAEGGIVPTILVLTALSLFFMLLYKISFTGCFSSKTSFVYYSFFLLPFLICANFEWPLRHPSIFLLFCIFIGFALSDTKGVEIKLSPWHRTALSGVALLALCLSFFFCADEIRLGTFYADFKEGPSVTEKVGQLSTISRSPFNGLRALGVAIPEYTRQAMKSPDDQFARKLLPLAKKLSHAYNMEAFWFNLALLKYRTGDYSGAKLALGRTLELSPTHSLAWELTHYLNILMAAEKTGQPIENFLPDTKGQKYELSEILRIGN